MRVLTDDEQEMVEQHYDNGGGLVGWFIHKENLEYDEWHGIIAESLIKSVMEYDEAKGKFSSFFHTIARNDMLMEYRKEIEFTGFEDSIEREIEESSYDDYGVYLEDYIASLSPRRQQVVELLIEGYNQREIAKLLSVHYVTIHRDILHIRGTLKEWVRW